jgi:hypothetical protein
MDKDKEKRISEVWCEYQQRMMMSNGGCGTMVLAAVVVMVVLAVMTGCKQVEYVAVTQQHTDTLWQSHSLRDSIYVHDSTYVFERGDTVMVEKWHTKYKLKEVHDTSYVATHDTIPAPYPVEVVKEVEKGLSWWQQTRMHIGGVVLWMIGIAAVVWLIKRYGKRFFHLP